MRAREAALKEVADSKLRRLLANAKSFICADIPIGDSVLFYKAQHRESSTQWRGPANVQEMGETGVTATSQSQTLKAARFCVRSMLHEKDANEKERHNSLRSSASSDGSGE